MSVWKYIKRLWAKEPKRTVPMRSAYMAELLEITYQEERMKADLFNACEQARYDRQIAEQQQYMKEQQEIIDQCKAEGMNDFETFKHTIACGYGPRINLAMPPAKMIVER